MNFAWTESRDFPNQEWDVVVIGAGVAGCVAAFQCANLGLKTLLVEGRAFPRSKVCGGCLNSRAIRVLEQIGLSKLVRDLRGETLNGISLRCGKSSAYLNLPNGLSVTRQTLDLALINAAHRAGATIVTEMSATVDSETEGKSRKIDLRCHGRNISIKSKVVVCADGLLRTSLHALPLMKTTHSVNSRVGVGAVFEPGTVDDSVSQRLSHHRITMIAEQHGYVGLTWAEGGRLSVAGAVDPHFLRSAGSPGAAVNQILESHKIQFPANASWHGTPSLTVTPSRNAAERIFVIGDAAGYVEPFTGEGMAAAIEEATSVVPLVCEAVKAWQGSLAEAWQRQHRTTFRKRQRICQLASTLLRRPWLSRLALMAMTVFPQPANYLVSCITRPTLILPQS